MKEENVIGFPGRFEAEIKLAEQFHDLVLERMARGRLPDSAVPLGDVSAVIDAAFGLRDEAPAITLFFDGSWSLCRRDASTTKG